MISSHYSTGDMPLCACLAAFVNLNVEPRTSHGKSAIMIVSLNKWAIIMNTKTKPPHVFKGGTEEACPLGSVAKQEGMKHEAKHAQGYDERYSKRFPTQLNGRDAHHTPLEHGARCAIHRVVVETRTLFSHEVQGLFYLFSGIRVRQRCVYDLVEAPGPQQSLVHSLGAIGGTDYYHPVALRSTNTVHLREKGRQHSRLRG